MGMDKSRSFGTKKTDLSNNNDNPSEVVGGGESTDENDAVTVTANEPSSPAETPKLAGLAQTVEDVDTFLKNVSINENIEDESDDKNSDPRACVDALLRSVEKMIETETGMAEEGLFLAAVGKVSEVSRKLDGEDPWANKASVVLQKAMTYLEEEMSGVLEDPNAGLERASALGGAMAAAGYEAECAAAYAAARRTAFRSAMEKVGFEGVSADDVQRMQWDAVAREIDTWVAAARACAREVFPEERRLGSGVLPGRGVEDEVMRWAAGRLLGFAEAVVVTKRSTDKVFKLLDIYEALRELEKELNNNKDNDGDNSDNEVGLVRRRVGEAAAACFRELENSIKYEQGRTPVPSGGVHPATRYVMNYVEFACAYKDTLEEIFRELGTEFGKQVEAVMEVLDANLEAKSRLYKDTSLNHIFLMNNGRYIVQKIKASAEIHQLMGDAWCRRRSSELRQHHKNYQRETWGKVLQCLSHEGLQVGGTAGGGGGKISKPVLKERFKSFNAMFDDIHKTQTAWVVSDDQLQSELRVSISAVMIPAYRSFLARFKHCLDSGRQTEKYVKYQPEDIETMIDDLFDGNPASTLLRKRNNN